MEADAAAGPDTVAEPYGLLQAFLVVRSIEALGQEVIGPGIQFGVVVYCMRGYDNVHVLKQLVTWMVGNVESAQSATDDEGMNGMQTQSF